MRIVYLKRLGKPDNLWSGVCPPRLQWLAGRGSRDKFASTTGFLDALFGVLGELLGSDDGKTLWELAFSEHLEVTLGKV